MVARYPEHWRLRDRVLRAIRNFFYADDFLEVDTPVSLRAPAPEPEIETLSVDFAEGGRRFLQPSPELPMKRLLAEGVDRLFQIAPVFRNEASGPEHSPEFRLLEWYRRDCPYPTLFADAEGLLWAAARAAGHSDYLESRGHRLNIGKSLPRISVEEAFIRFAGFSVLEVLDLEGMRRVLGDLGVFYQAEDSWNDLFHRIFLGQVEPNLIAEFGSFFLTDYPAPLASLARLSPQDKRVAERVELYVAGVELANGFGELTDPVEQRSRFQRDETIRREQGRAPYPLDEAFFAGLNKMDAACGMALGIERLLMLVLNKETIRDVGFVPWEDL